MMEDVRGLTGVGSLLFEHEFNELNELTLCQAWHHDFNYIKFNGRPL